jgi:flagellar motility protein MotE (MotC chaperone)
MNNKSIVILIVVVTIAMTLSFLGLFYVKEYNPTWLGLPPNPQDTMRIEIPDTVTIAETYEITKEKLHELEKEIAKKESYVKKADSLSKMIKDLKKLESISKVEIKKYQDSLIPKKDEKLISSQTFSQLLKDSINKLITEKEKLESKKNIASEKLKKQEQLLVEKMDSTQQMNFDVFAKIYNNSTPDDVAKILEKMDEKDAAAILKRMQKRKAGKVIDAMDPQKAAMILLLAGQD